MRLRCFRISSAAMTVDTMHLVLFRILLCFLLFCGHPAVQSHGSLSAGRQTTCLAFATGGNNHQYEHVEEEGDKKGYVITRVLSQGGQKGAKGKCRAVRLDAAMTELDPRSYPSAVQAQKEIKKGCILVNGARARSDCKVYLGSDRITVQGRSAAPSAFKTLQNIPFTIHVIYEDDSIAVVRKPPGVCSHPAASGHNGDLVTMSVAVPYFVSPAPGARSWRPNVVHRLDKLTEGLQLVAKSKEACKALQSQFARRTISKRYLAIVEGSPDQDEGVIDRDVGGKPAVSRWRVVRRGRSASCPCSNITLLEMFPLTGRTHQLRIHCKKGLGMPIIGDALYKGRNLGCGLLLAAESISFEHPDTHAQVNFSLGEPARFRSLWEREAAAFEGRPTDDIVNEQGYSANEDEEDEEAGLSEVDAD